MNLDGARNDALQPIARLDPFVHAPARLMILVCLSLVDTADFMFLLNETRLTRGNLSSHLDKLEQAGYVEIRKEFVDKVPRTLVRLSEAGRRAVCTYRGTMARVLEGLA